MSIGKKLKREGYKLFQKQEKEKRAQNIKRFQQEESIVMAQNGESYQRYWMGQHVIATRCKLMVSNGSIVPSARNLEDLKTIGSEIKSIKETVVDAIEIANFSQWLDNQRFYVMNETPEKARHDLWYMMQFDNFAPHGMPRIVYLDPIQGSIEYETNAVEETTDQAMPMYDDSSKVSQETETPEEQ